MVLSGGFVCFMCVFVCIRLFGFNAADLCGWCFAGFSGLRVCLYFCGCVLICGFVFVCDIFI